MRKMLANNLAINGWPSWNASFKWRNLRIPFPVSPVKCIITRWYNPESLGTPIYLQESHDLSTWHQRVAPAIPSHDDDKRDGCSHHKQVFGIKRLHHTVLIAASYVILILLKSCKFISVIIYLVPDLNSKIYVWKTE